MLILLSAGADTPEDYYQYAQKTDGASCGWTEDEAFNSHVIGEIPAEFSVFYLPKHDGSFTDLAGINAHLEMLRPARESTLRSITNKIRDRKCFENIEFMGNTFKADSVSQQDITDACMAAMVEGASFQKTWITTQGAVQLNYQTIIGLKYAIGLRRQQLVYEANIMKEKLSLMNYEQMSNFVVEFSIK